MAQQTRRKKIEELISMGIRIDYFVREYSIIVIKRIGKLTFTCYQKSQQQARKLIDNLYETKMQEEEKLLINKVKNGNN